MVIRENLLQSPTALIEHNCWTENRENQDANEGIEFKTRWLYVSALVLVIAKRVIDQVAVNIGIASLPTSPLLVVVLLLLTGRFFCIALHCQLKRVLVGLTAIALSFVSWFLSGQSYLPVATFLLLGVGSMDIRRVIKTSSAVILLLIVFLGTLQLLQFALTGELPGATTREDGRLRLSFFFQHPNMLAAYMSMAYIGLSLGGKEFKGSMAVLGCTLAIICMWTTDSRTAGLIMAVYIILRLLIRRLELLGLTAKLVYIGTPLFMTVLVILTSMALLPDSLYDALQTILSGRPGYWELQYQQLGGFTLFGQHALSGTVVVDGWIYTNVTIDCFYSAALLSLGSWSLAAFYVLYIRTGLFALRDKDWGVVVAIFCCGLYGFTEIHMIDLAVMLPLLFMGADLFCPKSRVDAK